MRIYKIAQDSKQTSKEWQIAETVMKNAPIPYVLSQQYGISLDKADAIVGAGGLACKAFGPWGNGFKWIVEEIRKLLKRP